MKNVATQVTVSIRVVGLALASLSACTADQPGAASESVAAAIASSQQVVGIGGKCLDVQGFRTDEGARIELWDCNGGANQQWARGDGSSIVGIGGKCLALATPRTNGSAIRLETCDGSAGQTWSVSGRKVVGAFGKCLDARGADTANGTEVIGWDCWGGENQKWTFGGVGGGGPVATGEQAARADDVVDTLGVNTHLGWGGSPYDAGFDQILVPRVIELGVRHIREAEPRTAGWPTTHYRALVDRVARATGTSIKFDIVTDFNNCHDLRPDPARSLDFLPAALIESFESLNEYDNAHTGHECPWSVNTWADQQRSYQKQLWQAVQGNAALASKWVFGPSLTQAPRTATDLGDLSAFMTHGNLHSYPGNGQPNNSDYNRHILQAMNRDRPVVATETGYHTFPQTTSGFRGVSERAEGKYAGRLLMNYFNAGVARVYFYELIDDSIASPGIEQHFGLVHSDGSEKPAFTTLKNMLTLLADPGPGFAAGKLDFRIGNAPPNLSHTLLQKRDGSFQLALWREVSSYDGNANADIDVPSTRVTVSFAKPTLQARTFDPAVSGAVPVGTVWNASGIEVDVAGSIVIVDVRP